MQKIFDLVPSWIYVLVIFCLLLISGAAYVRLLNTQLELADYQTKVAENTRKAEAEARAKETQMQVQVERVSKDAAKREIKLAARVADTVRAANGLRDQINRLNARPASEDPAVAAAFAEASAARELLGTCSERYTDVARSADELRDQVIGLQDYVSSVQDALK